MPRCPVLQAPLVAMTSLGCLLQPGSNTAVHTMSHAPLLPARSACTARRACRPAALRVAAQAVRPQVAAVAAPPSKEQLQQSEKPVEKTNGADVQGPIILNGQVGSAAAGDRRCWVTGALAGDIVQNIC